MKKAFLVLTILLAVSSISFAQSMDNSNMINMQMDNIQMDSMHNGTMMSMDSMPTMHNGKMMNMDSIHDSMHK